MVFLWGSKGNEADGEDNGESVSHHAEADEQTRLLPPPSGRNGYLSPDDPAVSPYNLWSVRFLRLFTIFFLTVTAIWWVLLLVSFFVCPPGMQSPGSGFFAFSYATLTAGNLLAVLLFFSAPSKAAQMTCLVLAVLLLVEAIVMVSVPQIRFEEGWVGIITGVWALLMSIWSVMTDRVVTWGKREEEERLTGREETRRTLKEWVSVMISTVVFILLTVAVVLLFASLILRARDSSLEAPGERYFVDNDMFRIHIFCEGNSTMHGKKLPTVLFEAGEKPFKGTMSKFAAGSLNNGTIIRYCYSDRPGFGWSDNAPSLFSAGMATDALSEALARAGEQGPWVLVSAGVGSIYSRIFSSRHRRDITGILLIDPFHEDLLYRLAAPSQGFLLWVRGVISPLGIDRLSGAIFKGRTRDDRVYGRAAYQGDKYIKAKLQESLVAESLTKSEVFSARSIQDKKTPLVVVSSGVEVRRDGTWASKQRDLSSLTNNLVAWDTVQKAPHEVWETYEGRKIIEKRLRQLVDG